jgi:hypothetical protein
MTAQGRALSEIGRQRNRLHLGSESELQRSDKTESGHKHIQAGSRNLGEPAACLPCKLLFLRWLRNISHRHFGVTLRGLHPYSSAVSVLTFPPSHPRSSAASAENPTLPFPRISRICADRRRVVAGRAEAGPRKTRRGVASPNFRDRSAAQHYLRRRRQKRTTNPAAIIA